MPPSSIKVALRGAALLNSPKHNKGTAFTEKERKAFQLTSRLPAAVHDLDTQCRRAYEQLKGYNTDLQKNDFLWSLESQNWVLFYSLLSRHLTELFPIIYTPTEAEAIRKYSHLFRRPSGAAFLSFKEIDSLEEDLKSHLYTPDGTKKAIDLVVVSDGEQILGIGDQGSGGVGISIAKGVIYTITAGIDPAKILPVILDVGTNNQDLLEDDLYVGWRHERIRGEKYDEMVKRFISVVEEELGLGTLLHFEDFGLPNAQRILDTYRTERPVFNDDIQGTGAVTLAALLSALQVTKAKLSEQKIIIYGAGTAGLGIARQIRDAMTQGPDAVSTEDANARFYLVDKDGLLTSDTPDLRENVKEFARQDWDGSGRGLEDVVRSVKPTALIGVSTDGGAFTESIVREMAKHQEHPIIFPLSNPTKLAECQPKDARKWSDGKALIATGSPFDPVSTSDGKEYVVAECNNALVYPGIAFGAILAKSKQVTDGMIIAATEALASLSPAKEDPNASLLPEFGDSRAVNLVIAVAVLERAIEEKMATAPDLPKTPAERKEWAKKRQWEPAYVDMAYDKSGEV